MIQPILSALQQVASEIEIEKERTIALRVRLYKEQLAYSKEQENLKQWMDAKVKELKELRQTCDSLQQSEMKK
jgi:hypothetical protein